MATPVRLSLPDGIGQGHRPMSDHMAATILELVSGDNTGHDMTGALSGTRPVTGPGHVRSPVNGPWHPSQVTVDRSADRSPIHGNG
ncbi:hypothetical protein DPMN_144818 [Dreissena polymorpha]|uniref:Uncharacterized protein n=1 Tax=Dreissena polymorpha TaxID=45954 RepID=A0A9D4F2U1_DREPO|nr:hypothetical protein DPMN_144818 [Dreissena polymorpha]